MADNPLPPATLLTIPQTRPFLPALAKAVLEGHLPRANGVAPEPLALTQIEILLPSRRACRALSECFVEIAGSNALMLPQIRPLGDVDENLALLAPGSPLTDDPAKLRPAISELERRLLLTELVHAWSQNMRKLGTIADAEALPVTSLAQATALAGELMELMDEAELEGADLDNVQELGGDFSEHWELTVKFLDIITKTWPQMMTENNQMTAVARRDLLIRAQAVRYRIAPPSHPVILAGEVGGVAATGDLMEAIARAPDGAIVLPGLDKLLDRESWDEIVPDHPEHPQYGLKQFLDRCDLAPENIPYVEDSAPDKGAFKRLRLISETMRPARTTDRWRSLVENETGRQAIKTSLAHFNLIEASTAREEAEVIALILRSVAESPDMTAALVTPDRQLARRVFARMEKWDLLIDDSGGEPLTRTRAGTFSDLVIETVSNDFAPITLLSLLKHPLTRLGRPVGDMRDAARALELFALRQPRLEDGLFAIRRNLHRARHRRENGGERHPVVRRLRETDLEAAEELLDDLENAFAELASVFRRHNKLPLRDFAKLHREALEQIAARPAERDGEDDAADVTTDKLWSREAGEALAAFFDGLLEQERPASTTAREYAGLYHSLMADQIVRNRLPVHQRLSVWGPMEARLLSADIVILGALNEGSWPQPVDADAWLSRPMRTEIGLPSPERRIGRSAHDMAQVMGAQKVYLTRATKTDGVPSVPSRWLLRLKTLCKGAGLEKQLAPPANEPWLEWARTRDEVSANEKSQRPNPAPPLEARPRRLAVTRIEQWIANPYTIFARQILNLEPLPDLGREPDAALRGQMIHAALHEFSRRHPGKLPDDMAEILTTIAHDAMDRLGDHPRIQAFWKPQFARFADWFGETEPARRADLARQLTELEGRIDLDGPRGPFTLTARADRMDLHEDGHLTIYDYKSSSKNVSDVRHMRSPQLPLEALIALEGGFDELGSVPARDLVYIAVTGREERGEQTSCLNKDWSAADLIRTAHEGLHTLIAQYDQPEVGYPALRRPGFDYRYDDFEHLARVREWAVEEDD